MQGRPVCLSSKPSASSVFQLESRPRGNGDKCISSLLERNESLHVSSIHSDRQMSIKNKRRTNRMCSTDRTSLASSDLVSSSVRDVDSRSCFSSTISQSVNIINRFNSSHNSKQIPILSCMENFGESTKTNCLSKKAFSLHSQA